MVIGVEQILEAGMEKFVARLERFEQKGFKKPTRVGKVPFWRACVVHGLHTKIFDRKWLTQCFALRANTSKFSSQVLFPGILDFDIKLPTCVTVH